jgi:hypothetical protein
VIHETAVAKTLTIGTDVISNACMVKLNDSRRKAGRNNARHHSYASTCEGLLLQLLWWCRWRMTGTFAGVRRLIDCFPFASKLSLVAQADEV